MKLKNTLGLFMCTMFNIREDRPVVELHYESDLQVWSRFVILLKVIVGGWVVHSIEIDSVKATRTDVDSWMWDLPDTQRQLMLNGRNGVPALASGHSSLTSMCRPKDYQLPVIANVGTIGHCDFNGGLRRGAFSTLGAFTDRKVMVSLEQNSESAIQHLRELTLKHEFRYTPLPVGESSKKYYFDPSAGLNPHLEG